MGTLWISAKCSSRLAQRTRVCHSREEESAEPHSKINQRSSSFIPAHMRTHFPFDSHSNETTCQHGALAGNKPLSTTGSDIKELILQFKLEHNIFGYNIHLQMVRTRNIPYKCNFHPLVHHVVFVTPGLNCHAAFSQISQWHYSWMMRCLDITSFSLPSYTSHSSRRVRGTEMQRELFDPERPKRSHSTCDQMIYCPPRTSKAPPALQFRNIHL